MTAKGIRPFGRRGYAVEPLESRRMLASSGDLFPAREYPGAATAAIAVGDVNGDGRPDLVTAGTGNTVLVRFGRGDGTFGPANAWAAGGTVTAVAVGDVTGDGKPDLVVGTVAAVAVLPNLTGAGTFGPPVTTVLSTSRFYQPVNAVAVADVNADGRPDVVAVTGFDAGQGTGGATVYVLSGTAAGTLAAPATSYAVSSLYPESLAVADVNGDGRPDLVLGVGSRGGTGAANDAAVLLNTGGGAFGPATLYPAGEGTAYAAVADVNGDGRPDIIVADGNGGSATSLGDRVTGQPILSVLLNQRRAGGGRGLCAPVFGTVRRGGAEGPLVELSQGEVMRELTMGFGDAERAGGRIASRDQAGLSDGAEDEFDGVLAARASLFDPAEGVVHVPRAKCEALGQEGCDRDRGPPRGGRARADRRA